VGSKYAIIHYAMRPSIAKVLFIIIIIIYLLFVIHFSSLHSLVTFSIF